jgi:single-strand DNA-binding protein
LSDLNRVSLTGRLTGKPEERRTNSGDALATFRLAVNTRSKGEKTAFFFDIAAFGKVGELVLQYLDKGSRVAIDGRLNWKEWDSKEGGKRQAVNVIANEVYFLDPKKQESEQQRIQEPADDDIPF